MPLPFLLIGVAAVTGLTGIAKGGQAVYNNCKAKELVDQAEKQYNMAMEEMEEQRKKTTKDLEKLGEVKLVSWSEDIGRFTVLFRNFKKVDIRGNVDTNEKLSMRITDVGFLKQMEKASMTATEVVEAGVASLGAGALAGVASYGGVMMFASASTGTAIASLSGAAATNATLAWFGGGALSVGGLGMAGGTVVLGGIVAAPVLAVAGFIMAAKSEENLAEAKKVKSESDQAVEKMETITDFMSRVSGISNDYKKFIKDFSKRYQKVLDGVNDVYDRAKTDQANFFMNRVKRFLGLNYRLNYNKLSIQDQKTLHLSWLMTQVLYSVLSAPILTKEGDIDPNADRVLSEAKESRAALTGKVR